MMSSAPLSQRACRHRHCGCGGQECRRHRQSLRASSSVPSAVAGTVQGCERRSRASRKSSACNAACAAAAAASVPSTASVPYGPGELSWARSSGQPGSRAVRCRSAQVTHDVLPGNTNGPSTPTVSLTWTRRCAMPWSTSAAVAVSDGSPTGASTTRCGREPIGRGSATVAVEARRIAVRAAWLRGAPASAAVTPPTATSAIVEAASSLTATCPTPAAARCAPSGAPTRPAPTISTTARRRAVVEIVGAGRVGAPLGAHLAAAGVGHVAVTDDAASTMADVAVGGVTAADAGAPRSQAARTAIRRASTATVADPLPMGSRPHLVVLAPVGLPSLTATAALVDQGIAHLLVHVSETVGVLGPLVLPGSTSCVTCADLHRTARDPGWPLLRAQLSSPGPYGTEAVDSTLAAAAAAHAALQALDFLDALLRRSQPWTVPATADGTLELARSDWRWRALSRAANAGAGRRGRRAPATRHAPPLRRRACRPQPRCRMGRGS